MTFTYYNPCYLTKKSRDLKIHLPRETTINSSNKIKLDVLKLPLKVILYFHAVNGVIELKSKEQCETLYEGIMYTAKLWKAVC